MALIKKDRDIPQSRVRELFDYDPETGIMVRKINVHSGRGSSIGGGKIQARAGEIVGSENPSTGYLYVRVDGSVRFLHRIVWLWYHGYMPETDIDHINRIKTDNRIENLREVSRTCNVRNRSLNRNSSSGIKGVSYCSRAKAWKPYINVGGVRACLGYFEDKVEAAAHRYCAEQYLNWHGCEVNSPAKLFLIAEGILQP